MFLEILEFTVENNKKCVGKTVLKMWSQMLTKNGLNVQKRTFRKKKKKKRRKKMKKKNKKSFH